MKLISSVISIVVLSTVLVGCTQSPAPGLDTSLSTSSIAPNSASESLSPESVPSSSTIEVDKSLSDVTITLPANMFKGIDMSTFDSEAYAQKQRFISAEIKDDGAISVTMTPSRHEEILVENRTTIQGTIDKIKGKSNTYIKDIVVNEDCTKVEILVDKAAYSSTVDFTPTTMSMATSMYQTFSGVESPSTQISIVDAETQEVISTETYPK